MKRCAIGWLCCLGVVLIFANSSPGQTPTPAEGAAAGGAPTLSSLAQRVSDLEAKMVTKKDLDDLQEKLLKAIAQPAHQPEAPAARPMTKLPPAEANPVTRMEFEALKDVVLENRTILEQVTEKISNSAGKGVYVPNIRAAMDQSQQFRKDMKAAVHNSMDQMGTLVIRNKTAYGRSLRIRAGDKDVTVYVPPGATHRESVSVGTVSTELVGEEAPKHWMLGPPNNTQDIDILPAPTTPLVVAPTTTYYYDYYQPYVDWWY